MDNGMRQADSCEISNKSNKAETINPAYRAGGIGLFISMKIIQGHNGKLWAESEIDKGRTFYFTLPLKK